MATWKFLHLAASGVSLHDALQALVDAGLTPLDAIRAATLAPSRVFPHVQGGEIVAGKRANLVLLDDNPITHIRNVRRIGAVVLSGRLYDRVSLDRLLDEAVRRAAVQ
jgi:imidazolonepropionase-like amidohydrolase